MNQFTAVYSGSGELINSIKYYDGFMGQRVGAISCLAFHPYWVCVPMPGRGAGGTWGQQQRAGGLQQGCPTPPALGLCPPVSRAVAPNHPRPRGSTKCPVTQGRVAAEQGPQRPLSPLENIPVRSLLGNCVRTAQRLSLATGGPRGHRLLWFKSGLCPTPLGHVDPRSPARGSAETRRVAVPRAAAGGPAVPAPASRVEGPGSGGRLAPLPRVSPPGPAHLLTCSLLPFTASPGRGQQ